MTEPRGLIIAAPSSGCGKTTVTLGLLRALRQRGVDVHGAKSGPDYIDTKFHQAATGHDCYNLDAWAMTPDRIAQRVARPGMTIIEGAMGLFDGASPNGKGAVADLARQLRLPVVLVVDVARMAQSVAPLIQGFSMYDKEVHVAAVILNKIGSARHESMLRGSLLETGIPILGAIPRDVKLAMPSRHLGLVQASEHPDLAGFLDHAARVIGQSVDLAALQALFAVLPKIADDISLAQPPIKRMAIAQDTAFDFAYPHQRDDWIKAGWDIVPFSPLANEAVPRADVIYLPGGYPELFAAQLAANENFMQSLISASQTSDIYGECGGYMVLGESLTDAHGAVHKMAGLLPLKTSFAARKLHLGYRNLCATKGHCAGRWKGHEFHYATTTFAEGEPLFEATDAAGTKLPPMGLIKGRVSGSFAHLIDPA